MLLKAGPGVFCCDVLYPSMHSVIKGDQETAIKSCIDLGAIAWGRRRRVIGALENGYKIVKGISG